MFYKISTQFKKYETVDSARTLLEELERNKEEITTLDLSMNTYTPAVMAQLSKTIKGMRNLKHIRLESIFDSLTFEEMSSALATLSESLHRGLRSFELPSNAVSCDFPEEFAKFLRETPLNVLNLYNCGLGQEGLAKVSASLDRLEDKGNLQVLNLSKNRINKIDDSFGPTIKKFKSITDLRIRNNTIEDESLGRFLKSIDNEYLEILDLSDNFVCGEAIDELGRVFLRTPIKQLYLQDTKMDQGDINRLLEIFNRKQIQALPGGLEAEKPSLVLDISCLDFEQDTVDLLEVLCEKFAIRKLIVFENSYTDIERLKTLVEEDSGVVVEEEEGEEEQVEVDDEIVQRIKGL